MSGELPRVRLLPPEEARKIAAGEVIERPASLAREFIDNAIDAGATRIDLSLEGGGVKKTEVWDDGCGMSRDDLSLAWMTYATSKIRSLDDLQTARSLGFRGEALAAASAVSSLEIITSADGKEGWRLEVGPAASGGGPPARPFIEPAPRIRGSTVRARFLFDSLPARKRFLKRDHVEAGLCRTVFINKALAFPRVRFRFIVDGVLKLTFPPVAGRKERFRDALLGSPELGAFLHEISALGDGFSVDIVAGGPELARADRKAQYVFANGRLITDFSLRQALEYGTQIWFPNNSHPVGAIYIDIDPKYVDFNIHPAKEEARFTCHAELRQAITGALRSFVHGSERGASLKYPLQEDEGGGPDADGQAGERADGSSGKNSFFPGGGRAQNGGARTREQQWYRMRPAGGRAEAADAEVESGAEDEDGVRFYGYLFGLFILAEAGDTFYLIDQHAAHERLLYEKFLAAPVARQALLAPVPFSAESAEDDDFLASRLAELKTLGIVLKHGGEAHCWVLEELPVLWRLSDAETVREILGLRHAGRNFAEHWAATIACHAAIKDGDLLDERSARRLAGQAIDLHIRRCPHGRPILQAISKADLLKAVKRTT